jgi:hypothetical protein
MKARLSVCTLLTGIFSLLLASTAAFAVEHPTQPITIKIEGAKMAPVTFSHEIHADKQKIACATCHHKDAENPKACTVCHTAQGTPGGAPAARDAFHTRCQGCHKENAAKGVNAPTKCNECHKK